MLKLLVRWLLPSSVGPLDKSTYRLRLVLAIQIAVFGLLSSLALSFGQHISFGYLLPETVAHVALGVFLWRGQVTWYTVLPVAFFGALGLAIGNDAVIEVLFIFLIIPLVLPFYRSTRVALTTQIIVWSLVFLAGLALVIMAPDRMPWESFVIQVAAIGIVGTLMVIFRMSLLRLAGINQRLANQLALQELLYDSGERVTMALDREGLVRNVLGDSVPLLGIERRRIVGRHFSTLAIVTVDRRPVWDIYQQRRGSFLTTALWMGVEDAPPQPISVHVAPASKQQQGAGMAVLVDIARDGMGIAISAVPQLPQPDLQ